MWLSAPFSCLTVVFVVFCTYMKLKQKITVFIASLALVVTAGLTTIASSGSVSAATCDGRETAIIACPDGGTSGKVEDTGVWFILIIIINVLSAGVGVLALAGIVYGGVLYTSAGGSPEQVKKAMGIITNVVIGVIAYAGMYALVNFLVPGGLF